MATPASAAQVITDCGTHVMLPAVLAHDLNCRGDTYGLHIAGPTSSGTGILDLAGHTINGDDASTTPPTSTWASFSKAPATWSCARHGHRVRRRCGHHQGLEEHDHEHERSRQHQPLEPEQRAGCADNRCRYGDGIVITNSHRNVVKNNIAEHNGPFDGIGIVGNSDENIADGNTAINQTVSNVLLPPFPPDNPEGLGPCGPFQASGPGVGRPNQDIGIRVEGPGADRNRVAANQVFNNQLNGISIHGWVCHAGPGNPPPPGAASNNDNVIEANNVRRNGFPDPAAGEIQDGIGILQQGPLGIITCPSSNNTIVGNTVNNSARHGISVSSMSSNNTIDRNIVNGNGEDGIFLNGPFTRGDQNFPGATNNRIISNQGRQNGEHDGHDNNRRCDAKFWQQNIFNTVNQACVRANNGTGTVIPPTFT